MTLPKITWSKSSGATAERRTASRAAQAPSSMAEVSLNAPVYRAIGVRAPATTTTSVGNIFLRGPFRGRSAFDDFGGHDGVAALFARFLEAALRAVHQIRDNVLAIEVG